METKRMKASFSEIEIRLPLFGFLFLSAVTICSHRFDILIIR